MSSVTVQNITYGVEDRRDGERVVTCRRGVGGQLLSSVVLPPEALPTIAAAFGAAPGEGGATVITVDHPVVRAAIDDAVAQERARGENALQEVVDRLAEANAKLAERAASDEVAEKIVTKLTVVPEKETVVPIAKARAAKESKESKPGTRRRPAPAKK